MAIRGQASSTLSLPPGYRVSDSFSQQGGIVSVAAAAGVGSTPPQVLTSRVIPPGAKAYIQSISLRVVDLAAWDQLVFAVRRNGGLCYPWDAISGEQVTEDFTVPVDEEFDAGLFEVVAKNISGTTETGAAPDAMAVRVIARWKGFLLAPVR